MRFEFEIWRQATDLPGARGGENRGVLDEFRADSASRALEQHPRLHLEAEHPLGPPEHVHL
jgi:hypothetical protein